MRVGSCSIQAIMRNEESVRNNEHEHEPKPSINSQDAEEKAMSGAKIFVGGITNEITREKLIDHFKKYGDIIDSFVPKDKKGRNRGIGFITYSDPSVVDDLLQETHTLENKSVDVKRATPKESTECINDRRTNKLFVGNLPPSITPKELKDYFSKYGNVLAARIIQDHQTGRSRGFGFVSFVNHKIVESILSSEESHKFGVKEVKIGKAKPKGQVTGDLSSSITANSSLPRSAREYSYHRGRSARGFRSGWNYGDSIGNVYAGDFGAYVVGSTGEYVGSYLYGAYGRGCFGIGYGGFHPGLGFEPNYHDGFWHGAQYGGYPGEIYREEPATG